MMARLFILITLKHSGHLSALYLGEAAYQYVDFGAFLFSTIRS